MSDHAWVLDNLASYVAGGLEAEERQELEEHADSCPGCARALNDARALDHRLEALFAPVRPGAALEDRSIQALRRVRERPGARRLPRLVRVMLGAAAVLALVVMGAGLDTLMEEGQLGFPWDSGSQARNNLKQVEVSGGDVLGRDWDENDREGQDTYAEGQDADARARALRERIDPTATHDIRALGGLDASGSMKKWSYPDHYRTQRKAEVSVPDVSMGDGSVRTVGKPPARRPAPTKGAGSGIIAGYSPVGKTSASAGEAQGQVRLWDATSKRHGYFNPADAWTEGERAARGDADKSKVGGGGEGKAGGKSGKMSDATPEERPPADGPKLGFTTTEGQGGDKKNSKEAGKPPKQPEQAPPGAGGRKIIRSGNLDFEVDSFDNAVAVITRLIHATKGGFVATINSDKLPNGKVRGAVVVRVPPDQLDRLVLDLRKELGKAGELKGQRIGSEDITKQYTDFESRLRAARTMEERLLKIIRDGKGQVKDLVVAELALGTWREKIEKLEGELRYYANLVALSTLTVNLTEKEIRRAAAVTENERVQAGIEVENVEKALREALEAVTEAKGRVTKSELKQHAGGQFNAVLNFEVAPESAGPLRDRLRQLGNMVRLEIDRRQQAEGGVLTLKNGKVQRGPTQFFVSLYNLANVSPRETITLKLAAADVNAAFRVLRAAVAKVRGKEITMQYNEQDRQHVTAQLDFDVRRADEGAVRAALAAAGERLTRKVARSDAKEGVTDAKVGFRVEVVSAANVPPRETRTLALEVADVDATLTLFKAEVREARGRVLQPQTAHERSGRVTAHVVFEVPLTAAPSLFERFKSAGLVRRQDVITNPQAPEGKLAVARFDVTLSNADMLVPRDEGLGAQLRRGLSFSLQALLLSARWLLVLVVFVLPWVLLSWVAVWVARRLYRGPAAPAPLPAPVSGPTPAAGG
jgi:anti-sigma factor RsiW